ncbi:MAG: hypothetical protein GF315_07460 [candidate division Zixibacteria bacterium]|nr:hypothetical protein [candidate division Zixibacteria bacterium]
MLITGMDATKKKTAIIFIPLGLGIIIFAEIMKISGVYFFQVFFTPVVWSGYIIFLDGINHLWRKRSLIIDDTCNFLWMLPVSIGLWYVFEFYNLFLNNWHYINLPENKTIRYFGYFWSFATIWPGILETYILLTGTKIFDKLRIKPYRLTTRAFWIFVTVGAVFEIVPFVIPTQYWAPTIWTGFVLLLDPINYRLNRPSILGRWEHGTLAPLFRLFTAGLICGFLWEFWNFWAGAKWRYTVPYLPDIYLFEMPIFGFLGFIPFAVEVFTMYVFVGWLFLKLFGIKCINFQLG